MDNPLITVLLVVGAIIGALVLLVGLSAGVGAMLMLLWNWLAVPIFGAPVLSFLQAWGLWILIGLVTGGLRRTSSK